MAELASTTQHAYDYIKNKGPVPQSELWKALNVSSRSGSRIATTLAEQGLITREQTVHNNNPTYLLTPTATDHESNTGTPTATSDPEREADESTPSTSEVDRSARQDRALELIADRNGLYQSELWKELDVSSRTGTRIATALEEQELIDREQTVYNGHTTYLLTPRRQAKDLDFSLLMAGDQFSPFVNTEQLDSQSDAFTQWLMALTRDAQDD